jgi:hypothetical protein
MVKLTTKRTECYFTIQQKRRKKILYILATGRVVKLATKGLKVILEYSKRRIIIRKTLLRRTHNVEVSLFFISVLLHQRWIHQCFIFLNFRIFIPVQRICLNGAEREIVTVYVHMLENALI